MLVLKKRHLLESQSGLVTVFVSKVVIHAEVSLPSQLIARLTVRDTLNYTTLEETYSAFYTHTFSALFIFTPEMQLHLQISTFTLKIFSSIIPGFYHQFI